MLACASVSRERICLSMRDFLVTLAESRLPLAVLLEKEVATIQLEAVVPIVVYLQWRRSHIPSAGALVVGGRRGHTGGPRRRCEVESRRASTSYRPGFSLHVSA